MTPRLIPPSLIGTVSSLLAQRYTHDQLDALFMSAGFPGDPPEGSKPAKVMAWLRSANRDGDDALDRFGRLIAEFMDTEPTPSHGSPWFTSVPSQGIDPRVAVHEALQREDRLMTIRQAEYEFLLTQEAMLDGENVDPDHLLAVGEREVAAQRLSEDSDFMKFAVAGSRVLGRPSPAKKGWLRRLLS